MLYMAVSLSFDFRYPEDSVRAKLIENCILGLSKKNIPFALMIGVNRQINPDLRLAGDAVAKSDIAAVNYLCTIIPKISSWLPCLCVKTSMNWLSLLESSATFWYLAAGGS